MSNYTTDNTSEMGRVEGGYGAQTIEKSTVAAVARRLDLALTHNSGDTLHTTTRRVMNEHMNGGGYARYSISSALAGFSNDQYEDIARKYDIAVEIWNPEANRPRFIVSRQTQTQSESQSQGQEQEHEQEDS